MGEGLRESAHGRVSIPSRSGAHGGMVWCVQMCCVQCVDACIVCRCVYSVNSVYSVYSAYSVYGAYIVYVHVIVRACRMEGVVLCVYNV